MLDGEAEPDRAAPVLHDHGRVAQVELLDEPDDRRGVEVVGVVLEQQRLVRAPEAEIVGRYRPSGRGELGDDLAVEVRPGRLAVEEQHGRAGALVEVVHAQVALLEVVRLEVVAGQALELLVRGAVGVHAPTLTLRRGFSALRERLSAWPSLPAYRPIPTTRPSSSRRPTTGVPRTRYSSRRALPSRPLRSDRSLWPWLLALLVLVLLGLGAAYFLHPRRRQRRDDDHVDGRDDGAAGDSPGRGRHDVLRGDGHSSRRGSRRESRLRAFRSVARHSGRTESSGRRGGGRRLVGQAERGRGGHARSNDHRAGDCADHHRCARAGDRARRGRRGARRRGSLVQRGGTEGRSRLRSLERAGRQRRGTGATAGRRARVRRHRSAERLDRD